MNPSELVFISQTELVCHLLGELDRQHPGARVNQAGMNAIIEAANLIVQAAKAGGITIEKAQHP